MATIINNPSDRQGSDIGPGFFLGIIVVILLIIALIFWVVPSFRSGTGPTKVPGDGDTNIQLPDDIDVNVRTPNQ